MIINKMFKFMAGQMIRPCVECAWDMLGCNFKLIMGLNEE